MALMDWPVAPRPCREAALRCVHCNETECLCFRHDGQVESHSIVPILNHKIYCTASLCAPPTSALDSLRSKYVFKLENTQLRARFWLMSGGFDHDTALAIVAARLGHNDALDRAVKCISEDENAVGQQAYVSALHSLRAVLRDPVLSKSPETLAAANVLYNHEIYLNPLGSSWTTHAHGLIQLMQFYGAQNIMHSVLDQSILIGNVGTIFMMAITFRQPCFLARVDWMESLSASIDKQNEIEKNNFPDDVKRIILASVRLPGLLCRYQSVESATDLASIQHLMKEVEDLRTELQQCRQQYESEQQWRSMEAEITQALAMPVSATSQMSADIFIIVLDDLRLNLQSRSSPAQLVAANLLSKDFTTVNQWTLLASQAKIKWLALKQLDTVSARACAACSKAVIKWVLELPCAESAEVQSIRLILQDLYKCLKPDS